MNNSNEPKKNHSSDFLDALESSNDLNSVGTSQLLAMLEDEVNNNDPPIQLPPKRKSGADRHRRISSGGYSSGEGSFTSSFLGGLEEDMAFAIESEINKAAQESENGGSSKSPSNSFTKVKSVANSERGASPAKVGGYSDSGLSSSSLRRQPFDNPFRSQKHDIFNKREEKDAGSVGGASASTQGILSTVGGRQMESKNNSVSFVPAEPDGRAPNQTSTTYDVSKNYEKIDSFADTFSLGSLGSDAVTASTRSTLYTHISKSTRSSRSSRSSRSTHSGASTQSSTSARERRERRELKPVKNLNSSAGSLGSIGSGSRRRRRRSGGSARDLDLGSKANRRKVHADLHSHHPTRYPKRSNIYGQIDEEGEYSQDELSDDLYGGMAVSRSDDEGLFRRVDKVKQTIQKEGSDNFLDSLLAKQPVARGLEGEEGDEKSLGETSFLSDFLNNRAAHNGTKQRKGGAPSRSSVNSGNDLDTSFKSKGHHIDTKNDALSIVKQYMIATVRQVISWQEEGYLFPRTRVEFVKYALIALIIAPVFHVALTILIDGGSPGHDNKSITSNYLNVGDTTRTIINPYEKYAALHLANEANNWAGSSQVMLSGSSSVKENFILIPDADWADLPPKPPKRLALPPRLDPWNKPDSAVVLFTLSASNGNDLFTNTNANVNLWEALQKQLKPKPLDAWPSWEHNSKLQFREDGFTVMYSLRKRDEAKSALIQLVEKFDQSILYEFVAWNEVSNEDIGTEKPISVAEQLQGGRTDIMIRRTISTSVGGASHKRDLRGKSRKQNADESEEPVLVMRRVKDLPVEDELTLREFEGPPLEEIVWKKAKVGSN